MAQAPLHERLFRALLRLFPADFRGDFGDDMVADFHEQHRDAARDRRGAAALWLRTAADVLRRAPREHLDVLARDAAYAVRVLRRHPVASAAAVLSLALGIGLNTAVYSVVDGVLWRSLPLPDSERLVVVGVVTPDSPRPGALFATSIGDLEQRAPSLGPIAAGTLRPLTIVEPGEPSDVGCLAVSPRFFDVLGVRPAAGRTFTAGDFDVARASRGDPDGPFPAPAVALLSDAVWRRQFGGRRDVVGTDFRVAGGARVEVVGVMGPGMAALARVVPAGCWIPDDGAGPQTWRPQIALARLAAGRSLDEANAELAVLGASLGTDPFSKEPRSLAAVPLLDSIVVGVRRQLLFLLGAVICVLLVTCANVVNLFVAHAAGRRDEMATRAALGASRLRLVRQSLTESLVIALVGGMLGFAVAAWSVPALLALAPPNIPRLEEIGIDWYTFGFTLAVAGGIGLACGVVASLPGRASPRTMFGAVAAAPPRTAWLRHAVVIGEVALALMLAVAGTLMVQTVRSLNAIDLGFDPRGVVTAQLTSGRGDLARVQAEHMAIVERVKALPGVRAAGVGLGPLSGGMGIGGLVVPADGRVFDYVRVDAVSAGYFEALGARLAAGRFFDRGDASAARSVIVVNEAAARAFWSDADPLGKEVIINEKERLTVIGVIDDIRAATLEEQPGPAIYQLSNQTRNFLAGAMLIRTAGDADALAAAVRGIIRSFDREQPFPGVTPLQERLDRQMAPRLFVLRLIGLLSALGLLLAVIGVYGVLAEFVGQRVPEFGVRMVVGATAVDVLRLVLGHGARLVAIGLGLGLAGSVALRDVMSTLVYGVQTLDPLAYSTAAAVLAAGTLAGCLLPARRAARLDPAVALRTE